MNDNPDIQCNHTTADLPYPPLFVDQPNATYARAMLSNMAEVVSEMSDVSRYFYISVMTQQHYSQISACFHRISIVEMRHLNMFAELARLLGADPRLWSGGESKQWWSPSFIRYPHGLRALIAESIKAEELAISKYSKQANTIGDLHITAVLNRIILDEQQHVEIFKEMYGQL